MPSEYQRHIACYLDTCHATICLGEAEYQRLSRTHATFYCPAGHEQHFTGKSEAEKLQRQLDKVYERLSEEGRERWETTNLFIDTLRPCPLGCGWRNRGWIRSWDAGTLARDLMRARARLVSHLATDHGCELPAEAEELLEEVWR